MHVTLKLDFVGMWFLHILRHVYAVNVVACSQNSAMHAYAQLHLV